jgi:hypothetical protein
MNLIYFQLVVDNKTRWDCLNYSPDDFKSPAKFSFQIKLKKWVNFCRKGHS